MCARSALESLVTGIFIGDPSRPLRTTNLPDSLTSAAFIVAPDVDVQILGLRSTFGERVFLAVELYMKTRRRPRPPWPAGISSLM